MPLSISGLSILMALALGLGEWLFFSVGTEWSRLNGSRQIAWVSIWHGLALSTSLSSLSYNDRGDLPLRALRSKPFCDGSHAAELPIEKASTTWPLNRGIGPIMVDKRGHRTVRHLLNQPKLCEILLLNRGWAGYIHHSPAQSDIDGIATKQISRGDT